MNSSCCRYSRPCDFGTPIQALEDETKDAFLERARAAVASLEDPPQMTMPGDPRMRYLIGAIVVILILGTIIGVVLQHRAKTNEARATADNLVARTRAWWVMVAVFIGAKVAGPVRLGDPLWPDLLHGLARNDHADPYAPCRPSHPLRGILYRHAGPVHSRVHALVWDVRHLHTGLCLLSGFASAAL